MQRRGVSNRGGLRAGRKRRSTENDDKHLKDVPDTSGRDRGRVRNMVCLNSDVRALGTIDGRHIASPTRAPSLNRTRNEGGTVAGRDQARYQPPISFGCDYCATTRRTRYVPFGTWQRWYPGAGSHSCNWRWATDCTIQTVSKYNAPSRLGSHFFLALVSVVARAAIFSFSSAQVLRTSAITSEQFSI
jgi:hypothetical protein